MIICEFLQVDFNSHTVYIFFNFKQFFLILVSDLSIVIFKLMVFLACLKFDCHFPYLRYVSLKINILLQFRQITLSIYIIYITVIFADNLFIK